MKSIRALVLCTMLSSLLATEALAQSRLEGDFDTEEKPWQESAIELPSLPVDANLLPFYTSPTATQTFAIDAASLSIGSDGVVRYTLVSVSSAGAQNISYEGIRCQSFEKRIYAFAHKDNTWSPSQRDQWQRISGNSVNRQHTTLAQDYFCEGKTIAGDAEKIITRIRWKRPLSEGAAHSLK